MNIYNSKRWTDKLHKEILKLTVFCTTSLQSLSCKILVVTMSDIFPQCHDFFQVDWTRWALKFCKQISDIIKFVYYICASKQGQYEPVLNLSWVMHNSSELCMEMLYRVLFFLPKQVTAAPVLPWHKSVNWNTSGCGTSGWKMSPYLNATSGIELCTSCTNETEVFSYDLFLYKGASRKCTVHGSITYCRFSTVLLAFIHF